ncbi:unnamed protein product [Linum trigynum]|uniref:Non-specific lipid-transfer protein n=1 Tax=Linum trigynum TaxID=586398 RepID=A0AAV2D8L5_9ROSI
MICHCATGSNAAAAISCDDVKHSAKPCLDYARGNGDEKTVPPKCCEGMRTLSDKAKTGEDKEVACKCLKKIFKTPMLNLVESRLNVIPENCRVNVPFKLSKNLQCKEYVN